MAPLFLLWAIRGSNSVPDTYFIPGCLLLATVPTAVLYWRIVAVKRDNDCQMKTIYHADDHRDYILAYLFATLLPFYTANLNDGREFAATVMALVFIIFLFWYLNLHYVNIVFALQGYRVFTIAAGASENVDSKSSFVLLTRKSALKDGDTMLAYRLSNSVFIER